MNDERLQILRMVQEGKVSPDEAAKLLDAFEVPPPPGGSPKPGHIRIKIAEGTRVINFSVGVSLARWVVSLIENLVSGAHDNFDHHRLADLLDKGSVGKILEVNEGPQRIEIYLEK